MKDRSIIIVIYKRRAKTEIEPFESIQEAVKFVNRTVYPISDATIYSATPLVMEHITDIKDGEYVLKKGLNFYSSSRVK